MFLHPFWTRLGPGEGDQAADPPSRVIFLPTFVSVPNLNFQDTNRTADRALTFAMILTGAAVCVGVIVGFRLWKDRSDDKG